MVNLIFSHVNGVKRKSLNGKTPYDIFTFTYGVSVADALGIKSIPADKAIQSPMLLSKTRQKENLEVGEDFE